MSKPHEPVPGALPDLATYRVFRVSAQGDVLGSEIISAQSDDEAMSKARVLANGHGIDLWERSRFLASYPPISAP